MKDFRGTAGASVNATPSECLELLGDVAGYPRWYPDVVRQATVLADSGGGGPVVARVWLHARLGPLERDFELLLDVTTEPPGLVGLSRQPNGPSDPEQIELVWRICPGPVTELAVELSARLDVPRLLPLQGAGDAVAKGFMAAAGEALESQAWVPEAAARVRAAPA